MTTDPEYAAPSPVFRVGGTVEHVLARDLARLRIAEDTAGLRHLEAEFEAFGPGATEGDELLYLDQRILDFGREIDVSLGVPGKDRVAFTGAISEIWVTYGDGTPPLVGISAEDALMRLRMTRRCRTYDDVSDADVIAQIGREHSLRVSVDLDGPTYDVVHQMNQTDLAFIRERARAVNGEVWFDDGVLHATERGGRDGTRLTLRQEEELVTVTARADLSHQRSEVALSGYEAGSRAVIRRTANGAVAGAEVSGGRLGTDVLDRAFGRLPTSRVSDVPLTNGEADAWARGEMLERARRFVTVTGLTRGTPDLQVGSRLELLGVAPVFDGDGYYVTAYCHRFDLVQGFRSVFEAERATIGVRS